MERKLLKFNMEIGDPPKDQLKKNEGVLTCYHTMHTEAPDLFILL